MIGAIVGDVVGSIYEFDNIKTKDFELFGEGCFVTDDSVMSLAVAQAILDCKGDYKILSARATARMQEMGRAYFNLSYGTSFRSWLAAEEPSPYNSYGNGAAMRISAVGHAASTIEQAKEMARAVTAVSHDHPEGIRGAESVAVAMVMARQGATKEVIRDYVLKNYYNVNFKLDDIREFYSFNETCQFTVPQAFAAFFEATGFEDAIRNAISLGGDSDTLAAITGGFAEVYYGVPKPIRASAESYLDDRLLGILQAFEAAFPQNKAI